LNNSEGPLLRVNEGPQPVRFAGGAESHSIDSGTFINIICIKLSFLQ